MNCRICGQEAMEGRDCPYCGLGMIPELKARELAESRAMLNQGGIDKALRAAQKAVKEFPSSLAPRLLLAEAYFRQSLKGGAGLKMLAEREFGEVLKIIPAGDKPANLAVLGTALVMGRMESMMERFRAGAGDAFFAEMLKAAMEMAGRGLNTAEARPAGDPRDLFRFIASVAVISITAVGAGFWILSGGLPAGSLRDGTKFEIGGPIPENYLTPPARPAVKPLVFNGQVPQKSGVISAHQGQVNAIAYSTDGRFLVTAGDDSWVRVWSSVDGSKVAESLSGNILLCDVDISPDGGSVVALDNGGAVYMWKFDGTQMKGGEFRDVSIAHAGNFAFSPNGRTGLLTSFDGRILLGDTAGDSALAVLTAKVPLRMAVFSPDGRLVVYGTNANYFSVWDLKSGKRGSCVVPKVAKTADVSGMAFTPDGKDLVLGFMDSSIVVWDLKRKKDRLNFYVRDVSVTALAAAPDGATFATGGPNGNVYLWNLADGRSRGIVTAHGGWIKAIAFSPDGKTMATGGGDGLVVLWR